MVQSRVCVCVCVCVCVRARVSVVWCVCILESLKVRSTCVGKGDWTGQPFGDRQVHNLMKLVTA
jgi:hypothetical protein